MNALLTTLLLLSAAPEVESEAARWRLDVDTNAVLIGFGGYQVSAGLKLPVKRQVRLAVSTLGLGLPEFGLGQNRGQGWTVYDRGAALSAQVYFLQDRGGLYAGAYLLYQHRTLTKAGEGTAGVDQFVVAATVGYEWFPFQQLPLYLAPALLFAVTVGELGKPVVGSSTFVESRFLPLPGLSLGVEL